MGGEAIHDPESQEAFAGRLDEIAANFGGGGALARAAGVSEAVVRKWRSGQSDPKRSHLVALSRAAGVHLDWLAAGVGPRERTASREPISPVLLAGVLHRVKLARLAMGRANRQLAAVALEVLEAFQKRDTGLEAKQPEQPDEVRVLSMQAHGEASSIAAVYNTAVTAPDGQQLAAADAYLLKEVQSTLARYWLEDQDTK